MSILVTGAAGFIGASVCDALLQQGEQVIGVDNLNAYYEVSLKAERLARLHRHPSFRFEKIDIARDDLAAVLAPHDTAGITAVLHLAAQAGVRHSMEKPLAFVDANITGQVAVLEFARALPALSHLVYASSSSVYGRNNAMPFRESDRVDHPGSFYAASKRAGELTADCYAHLYNLPLTGLRFFTVYGPWGRPDMAYFKFARAIWRGEKLTLYDGNRLSRDFTYIDDVVEAVVAVLAEPPPRGKARVLNVGNSSPEPVCRLVELLEQDLGREADIEIVARPSADVEATWASIDRMRDLVGWAPRTDLRAGVKRFAEWFLSSSYV